MRTKDTRGEMSARDLLIIGAITLAAALVIIVVFIAAASRKSPPADTNSELLDLVRERRAAQGETGETGEPAEPALVAYRGVLSGVSGNLLTLIEGATQTTRTFVLTESSVVSYNGQAFNRSRLYPGDEVVIDARSVGRDLLVERIIVLISASPETPAVTPESSGKVDVRPDGSIKPLGGE